MVAHWLGAEAKARTAAAQMIEQKVSVLPVLNAAHQLIGVITLRDVLGPQLAQHREETALERRM
ncbi:CBS domain-containing protein [Amantichitinum ursilacus]